MAKSLRHSTRGTVLLVSLCFVTVMGIALGSYLAVCSRAMNLSNRSLQAGLSKQLAEAGIEEALRAFNKNDWSDWSSAGTTADWTLDTTNKRATATISYPATKFGQGVTATVKLRVDNYDSTRLGAAWNSAKNYRVGEIVGYNGIWYTCIKNHSNKTPPDWNFWVPESAPVIWNSTTTYAEEDLIVHNEVWYRCTATNTNQPPATNPGSWTELADVYTSAPPWPYVPVGEEALLFSSGNVVRMTNSTWSSSPPYYAWRWRDNGMTYQINDVVLSSGIWYRCLVSHSNDGSWTYYITNSGAGYWTPLLNMWAWSAFTSYNMGDVVYHSGTSRWYRCIQANSNQTPSTTSSYWADTPQLSLAWNSGTQYSANDVVSYNGVWYLSLLGNNTGHNPSTETAYWTGADTTNAAYQWNATTAYAVGTYRCYGGTWYRCLVANTGKSPNNPAYWTAAWTQSSGVTTGAPVFYAEAIISLGDGTTSRTQLRALMSPAPLFPNAAAATGTISANSGGTVDSYDSTLGSPSSTQYTNQVGNTSTNYSAIVASSYGSGTAITLANTNVRGYLAAPPSSSSPHAPLYSSGGTVKGPTASIPNIDLSRVSRSPYIPQFDTLPRGGLASNWAATPKGTALALSSTVNIGTPGATTPSRYHYNDTLTIGGPSIQYLNINGPVILHINGNLSITQGSSIGRINISSTGSAEIHVAGGFTADAGGEGILSQNYDPKSLIIICDTTSNADIFYSEGVNPLYGVIYAPNTTNSRGYYNNNNSAQIFGAISAKKITYGANMIIHYDTSLRHAVIPGVDQPYTVSSWRELPATEQATMP